MIIYADVLILENLLANYLILFATSKFVGKDIKVRNTILSALTGSLCVLIFYTYQFYQPIQIILKILISIGMIWMVFKFNSFKQFVKITLSFYIISIIFGGAIFAFMSIFDMQEISYKIIILGLVIVYIILMVLIMYWKINVKKGGLISELVVINNGKISVLKAFLDTGNFLIDPISKKNVIIVELEKIYRLLPNELQKLFDNKEEVNLLSFLRNSNAIPFSSIGNENGYIAGFSPEIIIINGKIMNNVMIGIYTNKLDCEGQYDALLGINTL